MLNWKATPEDYAKITAIIERAHEYIPMDEQQKLNAAMDLTAAHLNGCPMDLDAMLVCKHFDLQHDLAGLSRFVDHETGRPDPAKFWPRLALADVPKADYIEREGQ